MEYTYNYEFSQKVLTRKIVLLSIGMIFGVLLASWQMINTVSIPIIIFSVLFSLVIASLILYLVLYKNWHRDRNDYILIIDNKDLILKNNNGINKFNFSEVRKAIFVNDTSKKIIEIILYGKKKYRINKFYENLDQISLAIKDLVEELNIEIIEKKRNYTPTFVSVVIVLFILFLSYYFQYTGSTVLVRTIADNIIPIAGGIVLLFLPKFEKGFLKGNRKNILSLFLIGFSLLQIVLGIE